MTVVSASHSSAATSVAGAENPFNTFESLTLAPVDRRINTDLPTAEERAGSTAATPIGRGMMLRLISLAKLEFVLAKTEVAR
jgi:hypothetical protein